MRRAFGALSSSLVDELELVRRQLVEGTWMSGTSKQTWWKPSPLASRNLAAPVVSSSG